MLLAEGLSKADTRKIQLSEVSVGSLVQKSLISKLSFYPFPFSRTFSSFFLKPDIELREASIFDVVMSLIFYSMGFIITMETNLQGCL